MYKIYLADVLLPITPSQIITKAENKNQKLSFLSEGQFNLLKKPGLKEYSLKIMLPMLPCNFAQYEGGFKLPSFYTDKIKNLKDDKKVFDFTVIDSYNQEYLNKLVNLESYVITDMGDVYVDIILKEYVKFGTKVLSVSDDILNVETENNRPDTGSTENSHSLYTVVKGDTLIGIAKKKYNDSSLWQEIYQLNKDVIDKTAQKYGYKTGGWWIFPGTVLTLP